MHSEEPDGGAASGAATDRPDPREAIANPATVDTADDGDEGGPGVRVEESRRRRSRRHSRKSLERRFHAIALQLLDLTAADRKAVVESMFDRRRRDVVSYWLQLMLSMGIATVGLVLGSTAVVIGAMLISPLMGPIVELGMGLVVGSPFLTLRSFGRMAGSVLAVTGGAALLTVLLPFREVTSEIAVRTSPTALDLLLAVFVAIAAAYTTARPGRETTTAAAGAAIGIALVPPVCVMGFGLGVRSADIAGGATLLFLTNLTAILFVSVVFFWIIGFERVEAIDLEAEAVGAARPGGFANRALNAVQKVFGSRHSRAIRVGLPLLMAAAVFIPLRSALEQVAWEVRTRSAVSRVMSEALASRRAVQSEVAISPGAISTNLFLVGSAGEAAELERDLVSRLAAVTGIVPTVRVVAVPDAESMRQAAGSVRPDAELPLARISEMRSRVGVVVRDEWPPELGTLVTWSIEVRDSLPPVIRIDHIGRPPGPAAESLLERSLSRQVGVDVGVRVRSHAGDPVAAPLADPEDWLVSLSGMISAADEVERLQVCAVIPSRQLADSAGVENTLEELGELVSGAPPGVLRVDSTGTQWSARYAAAPCPTPEASDPA